jgi:hypothetical protein
LNAVLSVFKCKPLQLALIIDEFQKTGADPILVRIVSGTHQGSIVLLCSHSGAISKKSYATMAIRILAEKPLIQATVFTTLHEAVAARDQVLHRRTMRNKAFIKR